MTKTCLNCEHRYGLIDSYAQCVCTGTFCGTEMSYGGRCAGPREGAPLMRLWEPRRPFWMRLFNISATPTEKEST